MLGLDNITVVLMAGGEGQRLRPLTVDTPKPMLQISGKPLLELLVLQLKAIGVKHVIISVNYKKEKIENYFKNGESLGIKISYLYEDSLRGTAGCLSELKSKNKNILVLNGDILTSINFQRMISFHQKEESDLTLGVVAKRYTLPYGVIERRGNLVSAIEEKPTKSYFINAGIYIFNSELISLVPQTGLFHMTELINNALKINKKVLAYDILNYWQDIGTLSDYQKVSQDTVKIEAVL